MLPCVVNYRSHPRRTFQFRHRDEKLVTRRDFCPFFSWACALFHFPYPVTLLFATHTKSAGVYTKSSHFGTPRSSLATLTSTLRHLTSIFSYSCELFCTLQKLNFCVFKQFCTLLQKQPGVGVPSHSLRTKMKPIDSKMRLTGGLPRRSLPQVTDLGTRLTLPPVAALAPGCYDLESHDPC